MAAKKNKPKPREPWERQEGESAVAYEAFAAYRDMGTDRGILKVAKKLSKSATLIKRWSAGHNWVNRVEEWDIEQDRLLAKALERERVKMWKLHADISRALTLKGVSQLNTAAPNPKTAQRDAIAMIESGMKNERAARGEEDVNVNFGDDSIRNAVRELTLDEARKKLALIRAGKNENEEGK